MGNVSHIFSIIDTLAALVIGIGVFYYFIFLKPGAPLAGTPPQSVHYGKTRSA